MPRNKTAKRVVKRKQASNNPFSLEKMEKSFAQIPDKLAAKLSKELNALKRTESKTKNALNQINNQVRNNENRLNALAKAKATVASKKLAAKTKKMLNDAIKSQARLNKEHKDVAQQVEASTAKHAKFLALSKHLNQFEKDWAKAAKAKAAKPVANAKPAKKRNEKKAEPKRIATPAEQPKLISSIDIQDAKDIVRLDEPAEVAS